MSTTRRKKKLVDNQRPQTLDFEPSSLDSVNHRLVLPTSTGEDAEMQASAGQGTKGDRLNIALLMLLYVLQGIPLGLAGSIPMVLQSHNIGYKDQAMFSFVYWPFSVKLLWAPIVDTVFISRFGRRKSWTVPSQYLIGTFMLVLSGSLDHLLPGEGGGTPNVSLLTAIFFMLNFLAATQDVAVDGWALTMLSRANIGWASTCNSVGQTAGYFLGNVMFLALESADFCNKWLRTVPQPTGLVTLSGFIYFWGWVFLITTTVVMLMKKEKPVPEDHVELGIVEAYRQLWTILKLPAVRSHILTLMTVKVGFAAADAVTGLKLIEEGVPKDRLALLAVPMIPLQILLPLFISKYTAGPRPLDIFLKAIPFRLLMGLVYAGLVWWTPYVEHNGGEYPLYYYAVIVFFYALHQVSLYSMFVAIMAFHAKISDPAMGGTYMTLLNTMSNLGGNWPTTISLWLVDSLTWKECSGSQVALGMDCNHKANVQACEKLGGKCRTTLDGYYIESLVCFIIGFLWLKWRSKKVRKLQELDQSSWKCSS